MIVHVKFKAAGPKLLHHAFLTLFSIVGFQNNDLESFFSLERKLDSNFKLIRSSKTVFEIVSTSKKY